MKSKRNILFGAIATIAVCLSIITGATFALFTNNDGVDVAITSGTVKVSASVEYLSLYSAKAKPDGSYYDQSWGSASAGRTKNFANGGTAKLNGKLIELDRITAGDKVTFNINITNESDVKAQYRTFIRCSEGAELFSELEVKINGEEYLGKTAYTAWQALKIGDTIDPVSVEIGLPIEANVQGASCKISYGIEAVQGNAFVQNAASDTLEIYTPSDLVYLGKVVAAKNTMDGSASIADGTLEKGVTKVVLKNDIDFKNETFKPIGYVDQTGGATNGTFNGEFDGNGYTIKNVNINVSEKTDYLDDNNKVYGVGLFTRLGAKANVHNVNFEGVTVGGDDYNVYSIAGTVAGYVTSGAKIDSVKVSDTTVYAATKHGAIAGMLEGEGAHAVTNCTLEKVTVNGNYSFGLVAGLVFGDVDFSGTTADENSHTVSVEFENSEFKSTDKQLTVDGYTFNYISAWGYRLWLTDPNDAFAAKRAADYANSRNVYALDETQPIAFFDEIIYVNATDVYDLSPQKDAEGNMIYRVYDENGLHAFAAAVNAGGGAIDGKIVTLENDIALTSAFSGIGMSSNHFKGTFNGNNHTISDFSQRKFIPQPNYGGGLFIALENATVKNLKISVKSVGTGATNVVGAVAAYGYGVVNFENVTVIPEEGTSGTVYGYGKVGGLLGMTSGNCTVNINDCKIERITLDGAYNIGGYIGLVSEQTVVNIKNSQMNAVFNKSAAAADGSYSDFTFEINGSSVTAEMYEATNNLELDSSVATLYSRLISPEPAATKDGASEANYTVMSYAVNE